MDDKSELSIESQDGGTGLASTKDSSLHVLYRTTIDHLEHQLDNLCGDVRDSIENKQELAMVETWLEDVAAALVSWSLNIRLDTIPVQLVVSLELVSRLQPVFNNITNSADKAYEALLSNNATPVSCTDSMDRALEMLQVLSITVQMHLAMAHHAGPLEPIARAIDRTASSFGLEVSTQPHRVEQTFPSLVENRSNEPFKSQSADETPLHPQNVGEKRSLTPPDILDDTFRRSRIYGSGAESARESNIPLRREISEETNTATKTKEEGTTVENQDDTNEASTVLKLLLTDCNERFLQYVNIHTRNEADEDFRFRMQLQQWKFILWIKSAGLNVASKRQAAQRSKSMERLLETLKSHLSLDRLQDVYSMSFESLSMGEFEAVYTAPGPFCLYTKRSLDIYNLLISWSGRRPIPRTRITGYSIRYVNDLFGDLNFIVNSLYKSSGLDRHWGYNDIEVAIRMAIRYNYELEVANLISVAAEEIRGYNGVEEVLELVLKAREPRKVTIPELPEDSLQISPQQEEALTQSRQFCQYLDRIVLVEKLQTKDTNFTPHFNSLVSISFRPHCEVFRFPELLGLISKSASERYAIFDTCDGSFSSVHTVQPASTLRELLGRDEIVSPRKRLSLAYAVLASVVQMHTIGLLHRNIRSENIVTTEGGLGFVIHTVGRTMWRNPVLGQAMELDPDDEASLYQHPKACDQLQDYDIGLELFSVGCLLLELGHYRPLTEIFLPESDNMNIDRIKLLSKTKRRLMDPGHRKLALDSLLSPFYPRASMGYSKIIEGFLDAQSQSEGQYTDEELCEEWIGLEVRALHQIAEMMR